MQEAGCKLLSRRYRKLDINSYLELIGDEGNVGKSRQEFPGNGVRTVGF